MVTKTIKCKVAHSEKVKIEKESKFCRDQGSCLTPCWPKKYLQSNTHTLYPLSTSWSNLKPNIALCQKCPSLTQLSQKD